MSDRISIELCPYDDAWPACFAEEERRILGALPAARGVHHVGSTSVPGLSAKPIIDIVLEAPDSAPRARRGSSDL